MDYSIVQVIDFLFYLLYSSSIHYWTCCIEVAAIVAELPISHFCQFFLHLFGTGLLDAYMFIIISSWWIIIKRTTLPQVQFLMFILFDICIATIVLLWLLFPESEVACKALCYFVSSGMCKIKKKNWFFILEKRPQHIPGQWTLSNFAGISGTWIFMEFLFNTAEWTSFKSISKILAISW